MAKDLKKLHKQKWGVKAPTELLLHWWVCRVCCVAEKSAPEKKSMPQKTTDLKNAKRKMRSLTMGDAGDMAGNVSRCQKPVVVYRSN